MWMINEVQYRELVSGNWRGVVAAGLRGGLSLLEGPYGWFVGQKNRQYDTGAKEPRRVGCPVISVGNITVGGTGKTPLVAWLAKWFADRQVAVTMISRGYGSRAGRPNDEALELAARLPDVPHLQNPDRVAAAKEAVKKNATQVLILDDAFQHRRMGRDLDIVLLDALEPFGYEHLLPRGLLREPVRGLARAQVVALSRSDAVSEGRRREIEGRVRAVAPQAVWLELAHRPARLVSAHGAARELATLRGQQIAAFCGIGNPAGFRHTLEQSGLIAADFLEMPDHCSYGESELSRVVAWLNGMGGVEDAICTRKDLVKIPAGDLGGKRLWALEIELEIIRGQEELQMLLAEIRRRI
jgi:tetraacyldisaccharide 4'-kinase